MKIIQINAVYEKASTGRTCKELSDELWKRGHEVYTAYSAGASNAKHTYKIGTSRDTKIHALCSRLFGLQGYYSIIATKRLLNYMDKIEPDIVHLRNLHANYINLPMLLKYLASKDIATVITLHDCWFFTGKCTHYMMDNCFKWQSGCNHCPRLRKDNKSWLFDRTPKMWKDKKELLNAIPRLAVVGVSDWITDQTRQSFLKNANILRRIYNWIDLETFYPRRENVRKKYGINEDKFIILTVSAGWNENSDKFKDFIKLSKLIDETMQMVIVGGGVNKDLLPENVVWIDYVDGTDELANIYSSVDVYVHLSRQDTFGKVVAEAMACGTPAIVYDSTALPELIGKGCGYKVACGNIVALFKAVILIKTNTKKHYSRNCRSFVEKFFEKKTLIKEMEILYRDILNNNK